MYIITSFDWQAKEFINHSLWMSHDSIEEIREAFT